MGDRAECDDATIFAPDPALAGQSLSGVGLDDEPDVEKVLQVPGKLPNLGEECRPVWFKQGRLPDT
jgi:hypothetical protein